MLCAHSGTSAGANRVLNMATWHRTRRLEIEAGNEAGRSHGPVAVNSALGSRVRRWYTKRLCKRDGHIHSRPKMDDPQDEDSSVSSHSCTCHKSCACACTCCVCGVDCQSSVWTTQCRSALIREMGARAHPRTPRAAASGDWMYRVYSCMVCNLK